MGRRECDVGQEGGGRKRGEDHWKEVNKEEEEEDDDDEEER